MSQDPKDAVRPIGDKTISFDGVSQFVAIDDSDAIDFKRDQEFTVTAWIQAAAEQKCVTNTDNDVIEKWNGQGPYPYVIRYTNRRGGDKKGLVVAARWDGSNWPHVTSKTKIDDGGFHHVAFVRRSDNGKGVLELYIDGNQEDSAPDATAGETQNRSPLYLGRRGQNPPVANYFTGQLKGLALYSRALTGAEIKELMAPCDPDEGPRAGRIVINNDEWTLSDTGFRHAPDTGRFATNVASWFSGGKPGKFLVYSSNFGLTQGAFLKALRDAGHTVEVKLNTAFNASSLSAYDGVFVAGNHADNQVLGEYVRAGGNVYLAGGTGAGGATAEANRWKPFLNGFGFKLEPSYNGVRGNVATDAEHPILEGVQALYQNNGNSVTDIDPESLANQVLVSHPQRGGLLAVYDPALAEREVVISEIFYDGKVPRVESDEFVEIVNQGAVDVDVSGWKLSSEHQDEAFVFPAGTVLAAGKSVRVYTNEYHAESGGFSFGSARAIWNNEHDVGRLSDASGEVVSEYSYPTEPPAPKGGKLVLNHDEWTLSDAGFQRAPDTGRFAANVAGWFGDGKPGNFLVYSSNFGLTGARLKRALEGAGHRVTVSVKVAFDAAGLCGYDGVFLSGNPADNDVLIAYVKGGGNVYLCGGTGWGGAANEANRWKKFLNAFGFEMDTRYNGVRGNVAVSSGHPVFAGVRALFQNNGNSIKDLDPDATSHQTLLSHPQRGGLIAVYDPARG